MDTSDVRYSVCAAVTCLSGSSDKPGHSEHGGLGKDKGNPTGPSLALLNGNNDTAKPLPAKRTAPQNSDTPPGALR